MKLIKKLSIIGAVLAMFICNGVAFAVTSQMNATLVRVSTILNQINPLINLAQKQQDPNARIQFQFDVLRSDIANIQAGIAQAVNHVSIQPRMVQPLSGDYLPAPESTFKNKNQNKNINNEESTS
jgi:RAQPRD family integrative conjugative element protein